MAYLTKLLISIFTHCTRACVTQTPSPFTHPPWKLRAIRDTIPRRRYVYYVFVSILSVQSIHSDRVLNSQLSTMQTHTSAAQRFVFLPPLKSAPLRSYPLPSSSGGPSHGAPLVLAPPKLSVPHKTLTTIIPGVNVFTTSFSKPCAISTVSSHADAGRMPPTNNWNPPAKRSRSPRGAAHKPKKHKRTKVNGDSAQGSDGESESQDSGELTDRLVMDERWEVMESVEDRAENKTARLFLRRLLEHPESSLHHVNTKEWVGEMKNICLRCPWQDGKTAMMTNSLQSIVLRCQRNTSVHRASIWANMVNLIQLVVKSDR